MILDYLANSQMFFPLSLPDCYSPSVCDILGASQVALVVKSLPASVGDVRGGHDNPLQLSCLENPLDREAWQATVHRVKELNTKAT